MSWEFLTLLSITVVRQMPQFWLEYRSRGTPVLRATGTRSTIAMFALYIVIWMASLLAALISTPGLPAIVLGGALLLIGTVARFVALAQLAQWYSGAIIIRESHVLQVSGIYRLVRHPLHLALLVELLGMALYTESWWLLPLWATLLVVVYVRNIHEDQVLREALRRGGRQVSGSDARDEPPGSPDKTAGLQEDMNPLKAAMNPNRTPPGSYGLPLLGETLGWLRDPDAWVRSHLRRYGNIFRTSVFGQRVIVMIGPEANRFILLSHRD